MSESPFESAAEKASQAAFSSVRLLISVGSVLRRSAEDELRDADPGRAEKIRNLRLLDAQPSRSESRQWCEYLVQTEFPRDLGERLIKSPQWGAMADELYSMELAGVDVKAFLGDAAKTAQRIMREMAPTTADRWENVVRGNVAAETADLLLSAEEWPMLAEEMQRVHDAGADPLVALKGAVEIGSTMQEGVRAAWSQVGERVAQLEAEMAPVRSSREAAATNTAIVQNSRKPTMAASRPFRDPLAPDGREGRFERSGVDRGTRERFAQLVSEVISDQHVAGLLVVSREWPEIAHRMMVMEASKVAPGPRLAQIGDELGRQAATGQRVNVAAAASKVLNRPAPAAVSDRMTKSPASNATAAAAANAGSCTVSGPPKKPSPAPSGAPAPGTTAAARQGLGNLRPAPGTTPDQGHRRGR
ncbi:hypothetical protein [Streptomyces sp. NPDC002067]